MISEAYVAGLFDGEGSIGRYACRASKNGKRYYRLHARITSGDRHILDLIQSEFEGKVYPKYQKPKSHGFDLHFTYRKAEKFLRRILPFLIIKKELAEELLNQQYPS
ncbi:hypothetical protein KAT51_08305 [bacterium]|nr:hypothetical protein [bacterium]